MRIRISDPDGLQAKLRRIIDEIFEGSLSYAAEAVEMPQATLYQVVNGGRKTVTGRTLRCLRKLLWDLTDVEWRSLVFSPALRDYERVLEAEVQALTELLDEVLTSPEGEFLNDAQETVLRQFTTKALAAGHHPNRVRVAAMRIRLPLVVARAMGDRLAANRALKVVRSGIRREVVLMGKGPPAVMRGLVLKGV